MKKPKIHPYPDFPDNLPSRAAKADRDGYRECVSLMRQTKDPADVAEAAVLICHQTEQSNVSDRFIADLWSRLRAWNLEHRAVQAPSQRFACRNCGEWRMDKFEGEGIVMKHARVVEILDDGEAPPRAVIQPVGCSHANFALVCRTCDHPHEGFAPVVNEEGEATPAEPNKYNVN